jgi:hypothetical protein
MPIAATTWCNCSDADVYAGLPHTHYAAGCSNLYGVATVLRGQMLIALQHGNAVKRPLPHAPATDMASPKLLEHLAAVY